MMLAAGQRGAVGIPDASSASSRSHAPLSAIRPRASIRARVTLSMASLKQPGMGALLLPAAGAAISISRQHSFSRGVAGRRRSVQVEAFFQNIFKQDPSGSTRRKYQARVDETSALEPKIQAMSDEQLRAKTDEFKRRVAGGESLDSLLPVAFAVGVGLEHCRHMLHSLPCGQSTCLCAWC